MADAVQAPVWWVPANLSYADPRTPFGRLVGLLGAHYHALTGPDPGAHLTALHHLRLALEAEERLARRTLEEPPHA